MRQLRRLILVALLAAVWPASAIQYDVFIDIEDVDDIYDLFDQGEIDEFTQNTLIEVLETGVDLNRASGEQIYDLPNLTFEQVDAILAYRDEAGTITNPAQLVTAGILDERSLLALAPFLVISEGSANPFGLKGTARYRTMGLLGEARVPGMVLSGRLQAPGGLSSGVAFVLTRDVLGPIGWDIDSGRLVANPEAPRLHLAKGFVEYRSEKLEVIGGSYKIGFAERLTVDTTDRYTPNGFDRDDAIYRQTETKSACRFGVADCDPFEYTENVAPDFTWRPKMVGVAAAVRQIRAGPGWMEAFGFGSFQRRSIFSSEVFQDGDTVNLYSRRNTDLRYTTPTLPAAYNEGIVGGRGAYNFGRHARVGFTGYAALIDWRADEANLSFRPSSRMPADGPFGAVGIDGKWGTKWVDLGAEVTRSFDSTDTAGGFGAITRGTMSWRKKQELELSLRYYDAGFANPYSGPISAGDELEGLRARDEAGFRTRYVDTFFKYLRLRTYFDLWVSPSTGTPDTLMEVRTDYQLVDALRLGVRAAYQDKDLRASGRTQCYEEASDCLGSKIQAAGQIRWEPFSGWAITTEYRHVFVDDNNYPESFRQDQVFWLAAITRPLPNLRLKLRFKYLYQDLLETDRDERSVWVYLEAMWKVMEKYKVKVRYDIIAFIDDRQSTLDRHPNPEHWFFLEVNARF